AYRPQYVLAYEAPPVNPCTFSRLHIVLERVRQHERVRRRVVVLLTRSLGKVAERGNVVDGGFLVGCQFEWLIQQILTGPCPRRHVQRMRERDALPLGASSEGRHEVRDLLVEDLLAEPLREI